MAPRSTVEELAAHHADQYQRIVTQIAVRLRRLAAEIEERRDRRGAPALRQPPHSTHAADLLHAVTTALANLPLERLTSAAAMADAYHPEWTAEIARQHKPTPTEET